MVKKELAGIPFQSEIGTVSGIWTTNPSNLYRAAKFIPKLGFETTKSIGPVPRLGNNLPIIDQYQNAVGLTNPGVEVAAAEIAEIYPLPNDVRLIVSIFGSTDDEFVKVASGVDGHCDGIELNVSCPHAEWCGAAIGKDPALVYRITKAVVSKVHVPTIVKLTPLAENIGDVAYKAVDAGAAMISGMNTWGPEPSEYLTAGRGGISGPSIREKSLGKLREIRDAVGSKVPIIGMGGVSSAENVREFLDVVDLVGVGSAVFGMYTDEKVKYYNELLLDVEVGTNNAVKLLPKQPVIRHKPYTITKVITHTPSLKTFIFDRGIKADPCQYVFAQIPKSDAKPFSIADDDPLTLTVRKAGDFTGRMFGLKEGNRMEIWGPYGSALPIYANVKDNWIVGGGTMIAPLHFLAKRMSSTARPMQVFIGAQTKDELLYLFDFSKYTPSVSTSTDDGTLGYHGFVTDLLEKNLQEKRPRVMYIGGPEKMMVKTLGLLKTSVQYMSFIQAHFLVERYTKCGVGVCGSCSIDGYDACKGYLTGDLLLSSNNFGKEKLDSVGRIVKI